MKNIIIKTNNEQLSDAEIEQFKNFDQLLDQYQQATPKSKGRLSTPKIVIIATLAGLSAITLSLLLLNTGDNKPTNAPNNRPVKQTAFIQPPIPQADIPMQNFAVDNSRDTNLRLPSGTEITIPARALLLDGKPTECEKVQVMVREMKTVDEVFLSGIPMQYDSAGKQYTFETAGMMQIEARCNNRPLSIDPKRPLSVAMTSPTDGNQFNLYQLDTNKRAWMFKGKDRIVKSSTTSQNNQKDEKSARLESLKKQLDKLAAELVALQKEQPRAPELANTAEWCIKLDVLPEDFPELRSFTNQLFEVDSRFKPLKKTDQTKEWTDIRLEQSAFAGRYWIKFNANKDSCRYLVKPVFPKALYAKAKEDFEKSFKIYKKELSAHLKTEDSLKKVYVAEQQRIANKAYREYTNDRKQVAIEFTKSQKTINSITRCFPIAQFGVWNCDYAISNGNAITVLTFMYNDSVYKYNQKYIYDIASKAIIIYNATNEYNYTGSEKMAAWMVVGNEIMYITASEFEKQALTKTLHLQKASKPILSAADFKEVYNNEILR